MQTTCAVGSAAATALLGFEGARLTDAHVHLDFMTNARAVAEDAAARGICLFANVVTPEGYLQTLDSVGDLRNVRVGLGLHPRWIADDRLGEADVSRFEELVHEAPWVGEVGLDFLPRYVKDGSRERQLGTFERIARACAREGGRVLSIHAPRSVSAVLDVLEDTGCVERCGCILHWFNGSTEELWRAIHAGLWFSVNERQARTKRAKEQLKLIPSDRMLLETDLPPAEGAAFSASEIEASLLRAQELVLTVGGIRNQ
ncbi:MAG: TatD family hydrolase [Coriobacteriales bacterium]|nr:TatD family hydrolase [Coriobacteriales bacterium]